MTQTDRLRYKPALQATAALEKENSLFIKLMTTLKKHSPEVEKDPALKDLLFQWGNSRHELYTALGR